MVDAVDSKSTELNPRAGSSPAFGNLLRPIEKWVFFISCVICM